MPPAAAPPTSALVRLAGLVILFHVLNSILQEAVFHLPGFRFTIMMSLLQTTCVTALALYEFRRNAHTRKAPIMVYAVLSIFATASTILTNEASRRVNYPTQVIFKSSKLLFVMGLRVVALSSKVRTSAAEVVSAMSIVLGLILFTYATAESKRSEPSTSGADMMVGVAAIVTAVCCDALLYIGEEKYCFHTHECSNTEVILYCNAFATAYSAATLVTSGQLAESVAFAATTPALLGLVLLYSLCNFGGTTFLLQIVSDFGSSTAVVVTSTRKMITVLCSYLVYPKPFTLLHFAGLVGVSYGIWLHDYARKKESRALKLEADQTDHAV